MGDTSESKGGANRRQGREERLAEALRANLRRRKAAKAASPKQPDLPAENSGNPPKTG
ncbi:MAG: hypothetical protein K8F58_03315 [Bauldia sp.]|nr:hypothetical protein [Bauldia sp.]